VVDLLHDFGGDGPVLHLACANGFPPGTYRRLAETLTPRYHVVALPSRPLLPGSSPDPVSWAATGGRPYGRRPNPATWRLLADDLAAGLDGLDRAGSGAGPAIGVGHSLGGVTTMWVAIRRPELFRAVVLIDPVLLPPAWLWAVGLLRGLGLWRQLPLVKGTLRRRRTWPSRQACFEQYRTRSLFARWPDESLWHYVEAGTRTLDGAGAASGEVELVYPPEWEAYIFASTPTEVWRDVPKLRTPALVLRGEQSTTFVPAAQARVARLLPQAQQATLPAAGHLLPMERPAETGAAILQFLDTVG
jgi:pimeloyl-ACP methyl ester carboxylesterase